MKTFNYLDFNNFFETKTKFDIHRPRIEQMASYEEIVLEDMRELMMEMALGVTPGSGTSSAIRLDDADILYLYQFLPVDWSKALWYRYGPGLINYARTRHSNIPEHEDETSHFHGVDESGAHLSEERPETIVFDEDFLLGRNVKQEKGPLDWMKPKNAGSQHKMGVSGKRKYLNIKFNWNQLYNKLNLQYKFAMQRVDDRYWQEKGQLPQLSGYKPMNFKGVDNSLNKYFKGMGMQYHHPEDYNQTLNDYQRNVLAGKHEYDPSEGFTTNDTRSPHEIIPINKGTHADNKWLQGHPEAEKGTHELKDEDYKKHLYDLMSKGLSKKYSSKDPSRSVQPFYLGSPKPGPNSSYNVYETLGLHKAMKLQNWELEKYMPHEFHQWAFDRIKDAVEGKSKDENKDLANKITGINSPKEPIDISEDQEFLSKLDKQRYRWQPVKNPQDYPKEKIKVVNNVPYVIERDELIPEKGTRTLPKWKWIFLKRYVNRFNPNKTKDLTSGQHLPIESVYKAIPSGVVNDVISDHPELNFAHQALQYKRSHQNMNDLLDREKEQSHGVSGQKKVVPVKGGFKLSSRYQQHKFSGKEEDLPQASHTDVMVEGVWHTYGGEDGNILEYHTGDKKWYKMPEQKVFVPLLHRGQVLPSEKQLGKGINVGSFGHSQVAEVETNHFGSNPDEDEQEVSKETAEKYADKGVPYKMKDGKYFVNKNKYFWKAAEEGDQPSEEFFGDEAADHNNVIRNTQHAKEHMKLPNSVEQKDRLVKYNTEVNRGYAKDASGKTKPVIRVGFEDPNGIPVLRSVHDGVQDAINELKGNEPLIDELTSEVNALWTYGTMILKANVAHPQFFKNPAYEEHLKKEIEDLPKNKEGLVDLEAERAGLSWQGTPMTGYEYRRKRVKNYITSFSQRPLSENIPSRRMRGNKEKGYVRGLEDHDTNRMIRTHLENMKQEEIADKRRRGERKHADETAWGLAEAQSSYHRKMEKFIQAQKENEESMNVKSAAEIMPLMDDAKSNNFAMLTLWAIESKKVPQARIIAQDKSLMGKDAVSEDVATDFNFPESYPHQYKKALAIQLEHAKDWAKSKQHEEWNERLKKSIEQGSLYEGATKAIPNEDFVKKHSNQNVVDDVFNRTYEYDARASTGLIKSELQPSKISDETPDKGPMYDDIYNAVYNQLKEQHADGLINFGNNDEEGRDQFVSEVGPSIDRFLKIDDRDQSRAAINAFFDFLLNGINVNSIPSKEYLDKHREQIEGNGFSFGEMLDESPHNGIRFLKNKFKTDLKNRLDHLEHLYAASEGKTDKSLNTYIASSVGKHKNAGKTIALNDYDEEIQKVEHQRKHGWQEKLVKLKGEREGYTKAYDKIANTLILNSMNIETVKKLGEMVKESKQKLIRNALEDAFLDQTVKQLSHVHHWVEISDEVIDGAQYLKDILGKDFYESFKKEYRALAERHERSYGETG